MKKKKIEHYSDKEALEFHNSNKSGKIEIISSKPMTTKRDLALAYSPGVAAPVKAIFKDPDLAYDYTTKGNLVAVISNGSAILGLGNLGALASKPVMEGKAVLFKRFADIDSIDLEIDSKSRMITGWNIRLEDQKRVTVEGLRAMNFNTLAVGDSYNDANMLAEAHVGILFRPPQNVIDEYPQFPIVNDYVALMAEIEAAAADLGE